MEKKLLPNLFGVGLSPHIICINATEGVKFVSPLRQTQTRLTLGPSVFLVTPLNTKTWPAILNHKPEWHRDAIFLFSVDKAKVSIEAGLCGSSIVQPV